MLLKRKLPPDILGSECSGHTGRKRCLTFLADQRRYAHVHGHLDHLAVLDFQIQLFDPGTGLDIERCLVRHPVVVDIFCNAADAVAAHQAAGPVGIIHLHREIGDLRRLDQDEAVRSDAEMPVGDQLRQPAGFQRQLFLKAVYIYIVISDPVHFRKFHDSTSG